MRPMMTRCSVSDHDNPRGSCNRARNWVRRHRIMHSWAYIIRRATAGPTMPDTYPVRIRLGASDSRTQQTGSEPVNRNVLRSRCQGAIAHRRRLCPMVGQSDGGDLYDGASAPSFNLCISRDRGMYIQYVQARIIATCLPDP